MSDETIIKEKHAVIKVVGVGSAGGLALESMIKAKIQGVDFVAANTNAQVLKYSSAHTKIQLGGNVTRVLGAFTVGLVSLPFANEGKRRMATAEEGFCELGTRATGNRPPRRILLLPGRPARSPLPIKLKHK